MIYLIAKHNDQRTSPPFRTNDVLILIRVSSFDQTVEGDQLREKNKSDHSYVLVIVALSWNELFTEGKHPSLPF